MNKLLKRIITTMGAMFLIMAPQAGLIAGSAHAATVDIQKSVCDGSQFQNDATCEETEGSSFYDLMKKIIDIFSIVVGSISVIMIIVGGFRYVISNGDTNGVSGAKNTILYAIVGLVIVLFAQVIVNFVLVNAKTE